MPPIPEVNTVNQFPKDAAHAAHVATSRDGAPDGDTEAPCPEDRDTTQRVLEIQRQKLESKRQRALEDAINQENPIDPTETSGDYSRSS